MWASGLFKAATLLGLASSAVAQTQQFLKVPNSDITVWSWRMPDSASVKGGFTFGYALPPEANKDEYIGHIVGSIPSGNGYAGITHNGGMTSNLLLVAWPDGTKVRTSFRYAA